MSNPVHPLFEPFLEAAMVIGNIRPLTADEQDRANQAEFDASIVELIDARRKLDDYVETLKQEGLTP